MPSSASHRGADRRGTTNPHASASSTAANQRRQGLRRAPRAPRALHDCSHRQTSNDILDRKPTGRLARRRNNRPDHRVPGGARNLSHNSSRRELVGTCRARASHRRRRQTPTDSPARLQYLGRLGPEGYRRQPPGSRQGHGRHRPHQPRLAVHQHRRRLARKAGRPLQCHPTQRQIPQHEGPLRLHPRPGAESGHLLHALEHQLRRFHRWFQR
jgi:hypothetical protein